MYGSPSLHQHLWSHVVGCSTDQGERLSDKVSQTETPQLQFPATIPATITRCQLHKEECQLDEIWSQVCEYCDTKIYSYEFPLTKMFSGFISLCTIRCAWRYTRASPSCCMTLTASCSQKCWQCKMASNRSPPYSKIEIYSQLPQHTSGTNVQI